MVRRAGLIDGPEGRSVRTPNLSGGMPSGVAASYDKLARAADAVGDVLQPAVDDRTAQQAQKKVGQGDFSRTPGLTRQDRIANEIVDAGFIARGANDVDKFITDIETDAVNDLDVDKFDQLNAKARDSYLSKIDSRYSVPLGQQWDKQALASRQRVSALANQKAIATNIESLKARESLLLDRASGASNADTAEFQDIVGELESIWGARQAIAADGMAESEIEALRSNLYSKVEANRIGDVARQTYIDGGRTDEAYASSMKMLDEAIASTDLSLSRTERATYLGAARSEINAERSEMRRQEADLDRRIREAERDAAMQFGIDYGDANLRAGEGYGPDEAELLDLMKLAIQSGKPAYAAKVMRLKQTSDLQQSMRGLSIPEQEATVGALEARAANGDDTAASALDSARKVASAARSAATNDPATYAALSEKRDVPRIDWANPANTAETMTGRFMDDEIAAASLGVAPRYFSPADRAQLKAIADKGGADALQVATMIVASAHAAGIDPLRPLEQISSASEAPLLATAGAMIAQGVPNEVAAKVLSGKAAMQSELVKDKMPKQFTQATAQRKVLGSQLGRMEPSAVDSLTRAADAHYAATLFENNGAPPGGEAKAYEASMRAVTGEWKDGAGKTWGGMARRGDHKFASPSWIRQSDMVSIVKNLTVEELAPMVRATPGYIEASGGRRQVTLQDLRAAYPEEAAPGVYYMYSEPPKGGSGGRLIVDAYGEPQTFDFNLAKDALKQHHPDAVR